MCQSYFSLCEEFSKTQQDKPESEIVINNKDQFFGLRLKLNKPRCAANIFSTGKVVCVGTKRTDDSHRAARVVARKIQKAGYESAKFLKFQITNFKIDLPMLLVKLRLSKDGSLMYEPEIFHRLTYRKNNSSIYFMVFRNGKLNITGGKTKEDIEVTFTQMYPFLEESKKLEKPDNVNDDNKKKNTKTNKKKKNHPHVKVGSTPNNCKPSISRQCYSTITLTKNGYKINESNKINTVNVKEFKIPMPSTIEEPKSLLPNAVKIYRVKL